METVEEKVGKKILKNARFGLRTAFHPTGIRDLLNELISYAPLEVQKDWNTPEAKAFKFFLDTMKYLPDVCIILAVYKHYYG